MSTIADLTEEQVEALKQYDVYMRRITAALMKLAKEADPEMWFEFARQSVDPVLAELDPTEVIPTQTGLAQAKPLTVAKFKRLQALMRQLVVLCGQERSLIVEAVGINS